VRADTDAAQNQGESIVRENHNARDVPALDVIVVATTLQEHFYLRFLMIKKSEGDPLFSGTNCIRAVRGHFYKVLNWLRARSFQGAGNRLLTFPRPTQFGNT
jgi:hypothetical protein